MRRTGIDLSPLRCNVVDAESIGRRRKGAPAAFRVHGFASMSHLDNLQALTAELKTLVERGSYSRRAWVNLWDIRSNHQYLLLPSAGQSELEAMARHHGASALGMNDSDVTVASSIGATRGEPGHYPKREVSFFAAGSQDIRARLRPIVEAGFVVEGVTTPCGALWSQARLRRAPLPGDVHAHIALGPTQSALGIFGDGALLYARELDWGYAAHPIGTPVAQDRESLADRLVTELRRSSLYLKQYWRQEVSQLLLCGDMPEIRSLTAPLIERLNIEVETLDTLEGIDAALPDGFAERAATFRLASAIAVEPPPANLLPIDVIANRTSKTAERIIAAGTAAAVAFGAFLYARANMTRIDAARQLEALQRETASLRSQRATALAASAHTEDQGTRRSAGSAVERQGPVIARVLAAVASATPAGVTLKSLRALPDGSGWTVRIEAVAANRDVAAARIAADEFLQELADSSSFGNPLGRPTQRVLPDRGVEVAAAYRVRKSHGDIASGAVP